MDDPQEEESRNIAAIATVTAAATTVAAVAYLLLDVPREPYVNRFEERQKYMDSISSNIRWETSMDDILIDTLMEEEKKGNKQGNGWKETVWKSVRDALFEKINIDVEKKHIESRLQTMRNEYKAFRELEGNNGFEWDPVKKTLIAPNNVWDDLLEKYPDKYKEFRDRGPKWDIDHLSIIIGNDHSTGNVTIGGIDSIDVDKVDGGHEKNDLPTVNDDISLDHTEEEASVSTMGRSKRLSAWTIRRKNYKKTRKTEIIQQMIEGMNAKIDQMTKAVDLNALVSTLYIELMKMDGFSKKYLECAYEILGRDVMGARMFLARDMESRKMALEGLYEKIGDV